jgi:hypothetical protein
MFIDDNVKFRYHKYLRWYISLIRKRQNNKWQSSGEFHHVFPVSIFGRNKFTIKLSYREHFISHLLLFNIFQFRYGPGDKRTIKMKRAIASFITQKEIKNNSHRYAICRKANVEANTGVNSPIYGTKRPMLPETREKLSKINIGKRHSEETKKKNVSNADW